MIDKKELLNKLDVFMDEKGITPQDEQLDAETRLRKYGLTAMQATKSILADIYSYTPPTGNGLARKIKNKIINVIRNVTISTVEVMTIKQNKFNELTYQYIEMLLKENSELKERVAALEKAR